MFDRPPRCGSYLLTFWEGRNRDPDAPIVRRFSLEDPHRGKRHGFADLEALVAVLEAQTRVAGGDPTASKCEP